MMAVICVVMLGCADESAQQDADEGAASTGPIPRATQATSAPNVVTVKQVRSYHVGPDLFVEFATTNTSQTYTEFLLLKIVLQDAQGGAVASGELSLDDVNPAETITKSASFGPAPDLSRVSQWTVEVLSPVESFRAERQ